MKPNSYPGYLSFLIFDGGESVSFVPWARPISYDIYEAYDIYAKQKLHNPLVWINPQITVELSLLTKENFEGEHHIQCSEDIFHFSIDIILSAHITR